mmetsp:Transcript_4821/g.13387  ORF Transcript_4821/g.13387 Transcript_4821/m.13387 type:complete len:217 (+) Transcript_4821:493-1143(+)
MPTAIRLGCPSRRCHTRWLSSARAGRCDPCAFSWFQPAKPLSPAEASARLRRTRSRRRNWTPSGTLPAALRRDRPWPHPRPLDRRWLPAGLPPAASLHRRRSRRTRRASSGWPSRPARSCSRARGRHVWSTPSTATKGRGGRARGSRRSRSPGRRPRSAPPRLRFRAERAPLRPDPNEIPLPLGAACAKRTRSARRLCLRPRSRRRRHSGGRAAPT